MKKVLLIKIDHFLKVRVTNFFHYQSLDMDIININIDVVISVLIEIMNLLIFKKNKITMNNVF